MEIRTERIVVYGLSTRESERERERCVEETQENEKALKSEDLACVSKYFFDSRIGGGFPHFNFLHCLKAKISWHMFANAVHCTLHTHTLAIQWTVKASAQQGGGAPLALDR